MKMKLEADDLVFDLGLFEEGVLSREAEQALLNEDARQQRLHEQGKKPDGSPQKHSQRHGRPSRLHSDGLDGYPGGDLLNARSVKATKYGAVLAYAGSHHSKKSPSAIAADLNRRGFKNTYLDKKGMDLLARDFFKGLAPHFKKLVHTKKRR